MRYIASGLMGLKSEVVGDIRKEKTTRILAFAAKNGHTIRSDAKMLFGISRAMSSRILKRAVAGELLYQEGCGKNTRYGKQGFGNTQQMAGEKP